MKKYVEPKAETVAFDTDENICDDYGLGDTEIGASLHGGRFFLDLEEQSLDWFNDIH